MIPHVPVITDVGWKGHISTSEETEMDHPVSGTHLVKYGTGDHGSIISPELVVTTTDANIFSKFSLNFVFAS
jgi:hypothetical protein